MSMKKVLVVRCGALGDLVYATSVIDALLMEYGKETIIDFVCTPGSGKLFRNDPRIDKVFNLKHKKIPLMLSLEKRKIVQYSKQNNYDLLINFEFGKQFKDLLTSIQAKEKIGAQFNTVESNSKINRGEAQKLLLKPKISQKNLQKAYPSVHTLTKEQIDKKFNLQQEYIVLSPSNSHVNCSGINHRAWDNYAWHNLINQLSKKIQLVIVGTKNEERFFDQLRPFPTNTLDLVGKNSIEELCSVVKYAKGVICTDSAVGHIAAAVNTPVFVLMGPNNPATDSPYQSPYNQVHIISANLDCSPCYKTEVMKQCKDNICMHQISVAMVMNELKSHLQLD
ncbi:MAG: glycosyltransferase family 9 protein [Epsilonproteobacteria bacterium]|nr:glycosyltransferase family 9 protein [Campylobacterota bacterium]